MKRIPALLVAAGAAFSAPAFADTVTYYLWDPVTRSYVERTAERSLAAEPLPAYTYPAPPSATYIEPRATYVEPSVTYVGPATYAGPDIVVTAPRLSEDQLITRDVADRIASNPTLSGRIGVETYRNDVTLTGRTVTQGQAERAEREARSVDGVREVTNLVRPRVGG